MKNEEQQNQLKCKLEELSCNDTDVNQDRQLLESSTAFFCSLYANKNFRPQYKTITHCIYGQIAPKDSDDFEDIIGRADRLVNNLGVLQSYIEAQIQKQTDNDISIRVVNSYEELYDHVYQEHARLLSFKSLFSSKDIMDSNIKNLNADLDHIKNQTNDLKEESKEIADRLQSSQKDYIAILAIFAAVILAFSGGINFLSESYRSVPELSFSNLICIISLISVALIDLFYLLLCFVWRIIRYSTDAQTPKVHVPLIVFNFVFLLLFILFFFIIN